MFASTVLTGYGESLFASAIESQLPVSFERFYQDFVVWALRASDGPAKDLKLSEALTLSPTLTGDTDVLVSEVFTDEWALGLLGVTP